MLLVASIAFAMLACCNKAAENEGQDQSCAKQEQCCKQDSAKCCKQDSAKCCKQDSAKACCQKDSAKCGELQTAPRAEVVTD